MKTRRNVLGAAVAFLVMAFFVGNLVIFSPVARALDSTNASADLVLGQPDMTSSSANQGGANPSANAMKWPNGTWTDGKKLIVADLRNNRVLIYNSMPTSSNASADVVIGQQNMTSGEINQGGVSPAANTLYSPYTVSSDGVRLFVADTGNNRILIYNSIPTSNNVNADFVVGQPDFTHNDDNQGGSTGQNTLVYPYCVHADGTKLFITDGHNHRILIFNTIPTANNANADVVVGQADFAHGSANQGGSVGANTLDTPSGVFTWGGKMYVNDAFNNRVLIYNSIPASNNVSANVVVGQTDLTSSSENQGASLGANTLYTPFHAFTDGGRLYVSDYGNNRVLIYNSLPTDNNASADMVIGQASFTANSPNQGGAVGANTLSEQGSLFYGAGKLFVGDVTNNRLLIYSLDASRTWANKKSKNLGDGIKGNLGKAKISFNGKKTTAKKGRVYAYENGVLKKSVKIKKNGKWKLSFSEKQRSINNLYQFRFVNSSNAIVGVSDQFNYYLPGKTSKKTVNSLNRTPVSTGGENQKTGGENQKNEINSEFWGLKGD